MYNQSNATFSIKNNINKTKIRNFLNKLNKKAKQDEVAMLLANDTKVITYRLATNGSIPKQDNIDVLANTLIFYTFDALLK